MLWFDNYKINNTNNLQEIADRIETHTHILVDIQMQLIFQVQKAIFICLLFLILSATDIQKVNKRRTDLVDKLVR